MKKRIFVAVELNSEIKEKIQKLQEKLNNDKIFEKIKVKFVRPDLLHLTLIFLGDIDQGQIDELKEVIEESVRDFKPFAIKFEGLGAFPNQEQASVLWIGSSENQRLIELQNLISQRLKNLQFDIESRDFTPHLTFARIRNKTDVRRNLLKINSIHFGSCKINELIIFESNMTPDGPIHKVVEKYSLGGK